MGRFVERVLFNTPWTVSVFRSWVENIPHWVRSLPRMAVTTLEEKRDGIKNDFLESVATAKKHYYTLTNKDKFV